MEPIRILQIGLGPLGRKTAQFIRERKNVVTVGAVDKDPALIGKDFGALCEVDVEGVTVSGSVAEALAKQPADAVILTTVSDMARITPQILEILEEGLPVVSTCEELCYPWETAPALAHQIDTMAKAKGVAVAGTGVNPGFLMDTLPGMLTGVCQKVDFVQVNRFQDAQFRRIPFQVKIGAGLSLDAFDAKKRDGALRHVGLTESLHFIARCVGWKLDRTEDLISPVVADRDVKTLAMDIPKGHALGVRQEGNGYVGGEVKIKLVFQAAIGEPESYDEVVIHGKPNLLSKIAGGVNGDVATCAIAINAVGAVLRATPGLKTMRDLPLVTYF
ncbi:MAG: hypothetical protein KBG02_10005 [Haliscomenobacter sp.]|nr:hypothetical protein [Haliscomenobacter sp.]